MPPFVYCRYELKFSFKSSFTTDLLQQRSKQVAAAANADAADDVDATLNIRIGPLDPPERDRTYSSIWDNDAPGTGHGRSMLDSPQGWSALNVKNEQAGEWMQIDAGSVTTVFGVRNRRRSNYNQYVTAFKVQYSPDKSINSNTEWSDVDSGATFTDTSGNFDALFATPVTAQYIRITVQSWVNHPSMRAGLLVNEKLTGEMRFIGVSTDH